MPDILPQGLISKHFSGERAASAAASITVNLAMIVAFASIANISGDDIKKGASLVVIGLTGSEAESESAPMKSAPPPPSPKAQLEEQQPVQEVAQAEDKPLEPRIALLDRLDPDNERKEAPPPPQAEARPSPEQLREAAERERKVQEAIRAQEEARAREAARAQEAARAEREAAAASERAARSASRSSAGDPYVVQILQHLQRFKRANNVGAGSAVVRFTIGIGGDAANLAVVRSSGMAAFDREAMQIVRRAAPFPKPPQGGARTINFAFNGT